MIGEQNVYVNGPECRFKFHLRRKVTFIRGKSGSGKSLAAFMVSMSRKGDKSYDSYTDAGHNVRVVDYDTIFFTSTEAYDNTVIFIDELLANKLGGELSNVINASKAYWIIFSRSTELYKTIPYSVYEVYYLIKEKGHVINVPYIDKKNMLLKNVEYPIAVMNVVTEDSKSSYYFFIKALPHAHSIVGAGTNTQLYNVLLSVLSNVYPTFVCVDSAAYGQFLDVIFNILELKEYKEGNVCVYLMESFEWLLLHSKCLQSDADVRRALEDTSSIPESTEYLTYENFYFKVLKDVCKKYGMPYGKDTKHHILYNETNAQELLSLIEGVDFSKIM